MRLSTAALFAGIATAASAPTSSTSAVDPDAELLRLCAAFHEAHAAWYARTDEFSDAWEAAGARRRAISDKLQPIAARTDAGRVAKARVALTVLHEFEPHPGDRDFVQELVYAALRDTLRPRPVISITVMDIDIGPSFGAALCSFCAAG
jgi:hypothetical protein